MAEEFLNEAEKAYADFAEFMRKSVRPLLQNSKVEEPKEFEAHLNNAGKGSSIWSEQNEILNDTIGQFKQLTEKVASGFALTDDDKKMLDELHERLVSMQRAAELSDVGTGKGLASFKKEMRESQQLIGQLLEQSTELKLQWSAGVMDTNANGVVSGEEAEKFTNRMKAHLARGDEAAKQALSELDVDRNGILNEADIKRFKSLIGGERDKAYMDRITKALEAFKGSAFPLKDGTASAESGTSENANQNSSGQEDYKTRERKLEAEQESVVHVVDPLAEKKQVLRKLFIEERMASKLSANEKEAGEKFDRLGLTTQSQIDNTTKEVLSWMQARSQQEQMEQHKKTTVGMMPQKINVPESEKEALQKMDAGVLGQVGAALLVTKTLGIVQNDKLEIDGRHGLTVGVPLGLTLSGPKF